MKTDKEALILVPEAWLKLLLKHATDVEEAQKKWEVGNTNNDRIHLKSVTLVGYAKSVEFVLEYNDRLDSDWESAHSLN